MNQEYPGTDLVPGDVFTQGPNYRIEIVSVVGPSVQWPNRLVNIYYSYILGGGNHYSYVNNPTVTRYGRVDLKLLEILLPEVFGKD